MKKYTNNPFIEPAKKNPQVLLDTLRTNKLRPSAQRLILYINCIYKLKTEPLGLEIDEVTSILGISRSSFYEAKACLCELGIIVPKKLGVYWVNPLYFSSNN